MRLAVVASLILLAACGKVESFVDAAPDIDASADVDAPAVACEVPGDCPSGICLAQECVNEQQVACMDRAPVNATSTPGTVTITYTEGAGWSTPADCAWTCDSAFCQVDQSCAADLPDVQYDPGAVGSRWFGGDDRPQIGIRSVGQGQSFLNQTAHAIKAFGFYFEGSFGSAQNGTPFATTLRFDLRNANGTILNTGTVTVPTTFTSGWVYWNVNATLGANTTYIVTAFVPGVYSGQNYTSGIRTDYSALYGGGNAFGIETTTAAVDMTSWANWYTDTAADYAWKVVIDDACPVL
jgi:hypothetical protein